MTQKNNKQEDKPKGKPGFAARKIAADILGNVVHKRRPFDGELDPHSGHSGLRDLAQNDRALVRAIVAACLRRRGEINTVLDQLLDRQIPEKTGRVLDILHVAIAQMLFMEVPDRAAVSIAVDHAGADRRGRPYKGLVNAVLRRLGRERDALIAEIDPIAVNTPDWLMESWSTAYGKDAARAIAEAHLEEAPLDLSVKSDSEDWAARLGGRVIAGKSVRLSSKGAVEALEGYDSGEWWVQDAAAALPARLLGDVSGLRVADLCAAPGGKTAQLAAAGATVTAVDISAGRLKRLGENMLRLGLSVETICSDLREFKPEQAFDAVLLDAPCSATGTIRRHPDVAWIKTPYDIEKLAEIQSAFFDLAAGWVKPGGRLVYCTCSLETAEGETQVQEFAQRNSKFQLEPVLAGEIGGLENSVTNEGYLRTLPSHFSKDGANIGGIDGFFAARFRRFSDE